MYVETIFYRYSFIADNSGLMFNAMETVNKEQLDW